MLQTEPDLQPFNVVEATSAEIATIIETIHPALEGIPTPLVIMSCLAIALSLMKPSITEVELQQGIAGTSEWICHFLASVEGKEVGAAHSPLSPGQPTFH